MDIEKAMMNLVKAARSLLKFDHALRDIGFDTSPTFGIYGHIADGILHLVGERNSDDSDAPVTFVLLENDYISDEQCASLLLKQHEVCTAVAYVDGALRK